MGLAVSKHEAFWEACGYGHTDKVKAIIDGGINVDWKGYTHESCAIHVASQGKADIVRMLIEAKCNVNVLDGRGSIAMHHAAMRGHVDIMQYLVDAGSNLDIQNENGWTPLLNAAYWCQPEAVELLIRNKCDIHVKNKDERTALQEACRSQHKDDDDGGLARITEMLVEAGADVNMKARDMQDEFNPKWSETADFTPLIFAAFHGHPKVAQVLIDAKCDIDTQTSNQWTALHWATDQGHEEVVKVLLTAGANPDIQGRRSERAIDRAKTDVMRDLLRDASSSQPTPPLSQTSPIPQPAGIRRSGSKLSSGEFVKFLLSPTAVTLADTKPLVNGVSDETAIEFMDDSSDEDDAEERKEEGLDGGGGGDMVSQGSVSNEENTTAASANSKTSSDDIAIDDAPAEVVTNDVSSPAVVDNQSNDSTDATERLEDSQPVDDLTEENDNVCEVTEKISELEMSPAELSNDKNYNELMISSEGISNSHVEIDAEDIENEAERETTDNVIKTTPDLDVKVTTTEETTDIVSCDRRFEESDL